MLTLSIREKLFSFAGHFEFRGRLVRGLEPRYWGWVFGRSDRFPSRYKRLRRFLASYLTLTSHQLTDEFKTNMNIVVKSNVRAPKGLSVSPRVFQTSQICDTHCLLPSPDHLCQPEAHRFWKHKILLFHLLCI